MAALEYNSGKDYKLVVIFIYSSDFNWIYVFLINLFIFDWVFIAVHRLSPVSSIGGDSLKVRRLLTAVASLVAEHRALGTWAQ